MTKVVEYTYNQKTPGSSAIEEYWYSSTARELYVKFKGSKQVAGYADVSPLAADKFIEASSKGSHYAHYIKPNYPGINTQDVVFRSAPGLAKKTTVAPPAPKPYVYVAPAPTTKPKQRFYVSGTILKPTAHSEQIYAESFEEAIKMFRDKYKDKSPEVKEVRSV